MNCSIVSVYSPEREYVVYNIKRFQTRGFSSLWLRMSVSTLFMNILEKATAIFVPMAVHVFEGSNFCEISFLHLAQQTSSKFCLKTPLLLPSESKICHVNIDFSLNRAKETRLKNALFLLFHVGVKCRNLIGSLVLGIEKTLAIYQVKCHGRFLSFFLSFFVT